MDCPAVDCPAVDCPAVDCLLEPLHPRQLDLSQPPLDELGEVDVTVRLALYELHVEVARDGGDAPLPADGRDEVARDRHLGPHRVDVVVGSRRHHEHIALAEQEDAAARHLGEPLPVDQIARVLELLDLDGVGEPVSVAVGLRPGRDEDHAAEELNVRVGAVVVAVRVGRLVRVHELELEHEGLAEGVVEPIGLLHPAHRAHVVTVAVVVALRVAQAHAAHRHVEELLQLPRVVVRAVALGRGPRLLREVEEGLE